MAAVESRGSRSVDDVDESLGARVTVPVAQKYGADAKRGESGESMEEEVRRLRQEIIGLRKDRDMLKKSIAFFVRDRN